MNPSPSSPRATRAVVYSRVSTDAQDQNGTSLETQERACIEHARSLGCDVAYRVRDSESGTTLDRPGLDQVRGLIRSGEVAVVIAYALDRIAREQHHIGVLYYEAEESGAHFELVTERFEDNATGKFIMSTKAFVAEIEREKIAERTTRGKAERARTGRMPQGTGRGMYGYFMPPGTGRRIVNDEQAEVVRSVFESFLAGGSTLGIANDLNVRGIPTFTGKRWYSATIGHLLRNESYTGRTPYRRTRATYVRDPVSGRRKRKLAVRNEADWIWVEGATPPIIDAETFARAKSRFEDPERRRRGARKYVYLLSGRVRCGVCGAAMVGQNLNGGRYRYYRCRRSFAGPAFDRCESLYVRADELESVVIDQLAGLLANPNILLIEASRIRDERLASVDVEAIKRRLKTLDEQKARLVDIFQAGEIGRQDFQQRADDIRRKRDLTERTLAPLQSIAELPSEKQLIAACAGMRNWLCQPDGLAKLLVAMHVRVAVANGRVEIQGGLPGVDESLARDGSTRRINVVATATLVVTSECRSAAAPQPPSRRHRVAPPTT